MNAVSVQRRSEKILSVGHPLRLLRMKLSARTATQSKRFKLKLKKLLPAEKEWMKKIAEKSDLLEIRSP